MHLEMIMSFIPSRVISLLGGFPCQLFVPNRVALVDDVRPQPSSIFFSAMKHFCVQTPMQNPNITF